MTIDFEKDRMQSVEQIDSAKRLSDKILELKDLEDEVANAEGEEQIHELAMRIVEELGVEFRESQALEIWGKTDAEISGQNVRVDRRTLLDLVAKAPSEFTHHARNPERTVKVGGSSKVVSPSYGPAFIYDLEGVRRPATREDLDNLQKLNQLNY